MDHPVFRLNAPRFTFRCWEDGCVVHDEADGSLHTLTPTAGALLCELHAQGGRASVYDLGHALLEAEPEPDELVMVREMMVQLGDIGVVRPETA